MSELEPTAQLCDDFCQELSGADETSFTRTYNGEPASRIICRSDNLTLMADLSPLCIGHLLLVSNRHYYSFAEVCREHSDEVSEVTEQVSRLYAATFGEPLILEHGSSPDIAGSACISHAHWHILPVAVESVISRMDEDGLEHIDLDNLSELAAIADNQVPYFYVANRVYHRVYGIGRKMRQQYLRSLVGAILGIPDPQWDWALVIRKEYLRRCMSETIDWEFG